MGAMNLMAPIRRFNDFLGLIITNAVGTMWCAYAFAALSLTSLKSTLAEHSVNADVQWIAQTFLQLVLLSVILVGQNLQSKKQDDLHGKVDSLHEKHDELHRRLDGD